MYPSSYLPTYLVAGVSTCFFFFLSLCFSYLSSSSSRYLVFASLCSVLCFFFVISNLYLCLISYLSGIPSFSTSLFFFEHSVCCLHFIFASLSLFVYYTLSFSPPIGTTIFFSCCSLAPTLSFTLLLFLSFYFSSLISLPPHSLS